MRAPGKRACFAITMAAVGMLSWCAIGLRAAYPSEASPSGQSPAEAQAKSSGCVSCHSSTDSATMHQPATVILGCTDCHGGNASVAIAAGMQPGSRDYEEAKKKAHVLPSYLNEQSANRPRVYAGWLKESPEYIQFVNPGDLRVADRTCGSSGCHVNEVRKVRSSMMTHGAMLWGAALYNNGAYPFKDAHFGESYGRDGKPQRLQSWPPPTPEQTREKGILPYLEPLQRWEISEPGNVLRVFERGGGKRGEIGIPERDEDPGRPDVKLGERGFGTGLRTDPVFLGLQKTRLFDPLLSFPGTNDQPGDYRQSGCTACHVVYANDRSAEHSADYAKYGNDGHSATSDPTIPKNESGHPIKHVFTKAIPTSQCIVCHIHPGTNMVATYLGFTWWDNEADGKHMYPPADQKLSASERQLVESRNPEGSALRGKWASVDFLKQVGTPEFNKQLQHTQFGDFHSHGWIFRAVYARDRKGELLDKAGQPIAENDPEKFAKAVHLKDIHLEKGMHCVDCHFEQDAHGNGNLYGETRAAIEITCIDCHGTVERYANLITSGPAAPQGGTNLLRLRTSNRQLQFYWSGGKLFQRSAVEPGVQWEVVQVKDTVTPGNPHYSEKARYAKLVAQDGSMSDGGNKPLAHTTSKMTCAACHTSWTTSCFGCHLNMKANERMPMLHNEGLLTRNWTAYNFQVLRDDVYMLGIDGTVTGHKVSPVRSACAIIVSSQNQNRDSLYYGQQTVSSEGYSGQAFSPYVPHTVRAKETKQCTDCHVSEAKDNNAWLSQVMMFGTGFVNFMGRYAYVANGKGGLEAIAIAEREEPEAIYGSDLHKIAYPSEYAELQKHHDELKESYEHEGEVLDAQLRGEYVYAAMGKGGLRVFDVANIDNKDFSERISTAPVSPLGQRFYVKTKYATSVASPSTLAVDPTRSHRPENEEQPINLLYGFLYVTDKYEGLVIVGDADPNSKNPGVATLLDGEPRNNFLKRALAFNPDGILNGARRMAFAGTYAYILADSGLVAVDLSNPRQPKVVGTIPTPQIRDPRGIAIQFRYALIADADGLKVVDITHPAQPRLVNGAQVPLADARNVYLARTYAYVSAGRQGIAIVDVERPEQPRLEQAFNAGGQLNDTNDLKIGMVSGSQFAFVADGKNGFKVVQLFSPETVSGSYGFSPRPAPKLIAWKHTHGPALAVSRGVDRDRAVDETGNQLAVFGRRGARPFNKQELERMYLRNGELYTVTDEPPFSAKRTAKK